MKRVLGLLVAVSLSCSKTDRPHPRVAEVTSPVHVTVRTIDFPDRATCDTGGGPLERLKCWVSPTRAGATYVEVGEAADKPLLTTGKLDTDLDLLIGRDDTRTLTNEPLKKVKLFVDPASPERVVVEFGTAGMVLFLEGNRLADARLVWDELSAAPRLPSGELDWSRIPKPPEPPLDLVGTTREQLDALAKTPAGLVQIETAVSAWISGEGDPDDAVFSHAFSLLSSDVQKDLELQLVESVAAGSQTAVRWFEKHPEKQTAEYTDALLRALEYNGWQVGDVLRAIVRLRPPKFVEKACERVEEAYFGAELEFDPFVSEMAYASLALLVHEKAKCPWVLPLLEKVACNPALACLPLEADFAPFDEDGRPRASKGLCTAQERKVLFDHLFTPPKSDEEDELLDEPGRAWGPLLLMAAEQQGGVPADLVKRTTRRTYLPLFAALPADSVLDACRDLYDVTPGDWACQLPPAISVSTRGGCRMEVDDVKRTLKLITVAPPPE